MMEGISGLVDDKHFQVQYNRAAAGFDSKLYVAKQCTFWTSKKQVGQCLITNLTNKIY